MTPPLNLSADVDPFVQAYESARRVTGRAHIRDHLPPAAHPAYIRTLAELVRVDLEYAWNDGRPKRVADYLDEFPELAAHPRLLGEVAYEEYRQRLAGGDQPDPQEYLERYGADDDRWSSDARDAPTARVPITPPGTDSNGAAGRATNATGSSLGSAPSGPAGVATTFPEVGGVLLGFRLIDELGRGAFGRVYLARQGDLADRLVALKVTADESGESRTLAQLQHTNIVPIYSSHKTGRLQIVCMPYYGRTTLADVISGLRREPSLPASGEHFVSTLNNRRSSTRTDDPPQPTGPENAPPAEKESAPPVATNEVLNRLVRLSYVEAVLWLASRLAEGLAYAHERGVIHRDLKPANMLLTDEGQPMLLDFNLADNWNAPEAARVGGTLAYMSPEQLDVFRGQARSVGPGSDVYALGLILFELLAGRHPFPAPTGPPRDAIATTAERRRAGPPRLRPLNPAVSPAVEAIVLGCLAADPADRYRSARALQEDIERHLTHLPLRHVPEPSVRERVSKWAHRHPRLTSSGVVAGVAAAVIIGLAAALWGLSERNARHEAVAQLAGFRGEKKGLEATLGVGTTDPTVLDEAVAASRRALARYGIPDDPGWDARPVVAKLPEDDRQSLRRDVGELLFLTARATALRAGRDGLTEAARLNELAARCFPAGEVPGVVRAQGADIRGLLDGDAPLVPPADEPRTAREAYLAAADLVAKRQFKAALPLARRAVDGEPGSFGAWFTLAHCYSGLGQDAKAEAAYDACLALAPEFYWSYFNRGLARHRQRDYAGAVSDFDAALRLRPAATDACVNRALARQGLQDYAGAVADLTRALDGGAPQTRVYFIRARLHALMKDPAAAKADMAAGLKLTPTDEQSWVARGLARADADPAAALADFEKALELNPASRAALQNTAHALAEKLGRTADAVRVLDRVVEMYPDYLPGRGGRGVLHARLGDRAKALADAEECLRRDREPRTVYQVAGIYALTSRTEAADRAEALRLLASALGKGYGADLVDRDTDLDPIRGDHEFKRLVAAAKALKTPPPR
jgi:serine/threonine protein kinase/tetratricopeptide (TPR) repeat protein